MGTRGCSGNDGRTGRVEGRNFRLAPIAHAIALTLAAGGAIGSGSAYAAQPFSPAWFANKGAIQSTAATTGRMPDGTPVSAFSPGAQQQAANAQLQQSIANLTLAAHGIAAMQAAQAAARQAALGNPSTVPDGLGAGGLDTGSLASSWINANGPTQSTDANGKTVVDIQQTADKAIANWQTFNVGKNTIVQFDQASADWAILNRITDPMARPSQIQGQIRAPGTVLIVNKNGIIFSGSSQINTRNLVAAAADISDSQFTANGIYGVNQTTASFTNAQGNLIVEAGAQIATNSPGSVTQGGGYVLLMGQQVNNAGDIETPQGQAELAAGDNFIVRKGVGTDANTASTTRGNEIAPQLNAGSTAGQVINTGLLLSREGDITLAGHDVQQNGVAVVTTTVNTRGTIHLLNSATDTSGLVTLGADAVTAVAIEDDGTTTALDSQRSALITASLAQDLLRAAGVTGAFNNLSRLTDREDESRIEIVSGGDVRFEGNSLTLATGGQIAVSAANRTFVADGAILDVAGQVGVNLAMSSNDVLVNVQGNELRDSPGNRDSGALFNSNITVDRRDLILVPAGTGGYATDRWYTANGLLEVSGYLNNQGHTIGEWAAQGGTIQLGGSEVVTQQGSQINLSGGTLNVATGYVAQTWLIGSDGNLYNANNAPADMTFSGIYKGFEVSHPRWGKNTSTFFYNPLIAPQKVLENGYTVGRDAGQLIVNAPTSVIEGDIIAAVFNGAQQNRVRDDIADGYLQAQTAVARAGSLSFGQYGPGGLTGVNTTDIQVGNIADVTGGMMEDAALAADRINTTWLDATRLNAEGFGEIDLGTQGNALVDAPLNLAYGGSLTILAPHIDIGADISARGGSIALGNIVHFSGATAAGALGSAAQVNIDAGATLDVRGLWTNTLLDSGDLSSLAGLAYLNGGSVTIDSAQGVALAGGSTIDVSSGGAALSGGKTQGGKGGNVTLIAGDPLFGAAGNATLGLDGSIRAVGFNGGGTLTLVAGDVLIAAAGTTPATGTLLLTPDFFSKGFSSYDVTGSRSIAVADATQIDVTVPVYRFGDASFRTPTGSDPAAAFDLWTPPLYLDNPQKAQLTQRAGGSLVLRSAFNAGTAGAGGGTLTVGTGAQLNVDPGQSIRLEAYGQMTVDGTVSAPGGTIAIVNDETAEIPSTFNSNSLSFESGPLSIWIGDHAVLDAAGRAVTGIDAQGRSYGIAPNGGAILLGNTAAIDTFDANGITPSTDAFIIIRPGALLDVSGAAAAVDLSAGTKAASRPLALAGNGGSIALNSFTGIYADGTLRGDAGGAGAAGGSLSVILNTPVYNRFIGQFRSTVPDDLRMPRIITITQADGAPLLPANLQPGIGDPALKVGSAVFSADSMAADGFDKLSLFGRDAIVFDGNVNLQAAQSIRLYNGALSDTDPNAQVRIAAPYVLLRGGTPVDGSQSDVNIGLGGASQQSGIGKLTVAADLIDLQNGIGFGSSGSITLLNGPAASYDFAGFSEEDFISRGDIRFLAPLQTLAISGITTSLNSTGNLVFTAEQLYPATGADVTIAAGYPVSGHGALSPDASITINSVDGVVPDMPDSVFGNLTLYATTINQGGILRAPLGNMQFGGSIPHGGPTDTTVAVNFLPGSITSISANGLDMPYGGTSDGTTYNYNGAAAPVILRGISNAITISAVSITESAGATLDLSGGGTLAGAGFVTGRGGSVNVLDTPLINANPANSVSAAGNKIYAIVPGYRSGYAPLNAENGAGDPVIGQQVTIPAGVPGLAPGVYTLLPSTYALLPGAFRVEVGAATQTAAAPMLLPNGSYSANGMLSIANTTVHNALPSALLLTPAATVRTYSSFNETGYSDFAIAQAAMLNQLRPMLPMDAKALFLGLEPGSSAAVPALTVDGTVLFQPAPGGFGGQASTNADEIVASVPTPGFTGISVRAGDLDALGASRLSINGNMVVRDGAVLSAAEVFLTGRITLESGAEINTIGMGAPQFGFDDNSIYSPGSNSALAVSNGVLTISGNIQGTQPITIAAGAKIYSEGTIAFVTNGAVNIDPAAKLGTSFIDLSVSTINLGDPAVMAGATVPNGLLLSQAFLDQLLRGDTSTGAPALKGLILGASQSFNLFGSVDLSVVNPATGKADLALILNTPAIYGYGAATDTDTLTAGSLYWNGTTQGSTSMLPPAVALNGPGNGAGTLNLVADTIVFGRAPTVLPGFNVLGSLDRQLLGFSTANLKAGQISANGNQTLSFYQAPGATYGTPGTGGDLNLVTPLLTGEAGSVMAYKVGGILNLAPAAGTAPSAAISNVLGAEVDLNAGTVNIAGSIVLPSGKLAINAVNDINLGDGARLDLAGQPVQMHDQTVYGWGGDVNLNAADGSIVEAQGAVIDLSAANNNAGTLSLSAANGNALMNGRFNGASTGGGYLGGSFSVMAQSIGDFAALNAMLDAGQIDGARQFDIKQGDLTVDGTIKARTVGISIDNGSLVINGAIDAGGAAPGTIRLSAKNDLTLAAGSVLDAHGTVLQVDSYGAPVDAKNKGTIELTATSGMLTLASGSTMNLTAPDGIARGEIDLNASRTAETSGDVNIQASGPLNITGARSIAVNAFWIYSPTDARGTIVQDNGDAAPVAGSGTDTGFVGLNQIDTQSQAFIAAAYNNNVAAGNLTAGLQGKLAGLTSYGNAFHLRPGVEIDGKTSAANPNGDLTVVGDLDLSGFRYGPNADRNPASASYGAGEPGALVIRAAGNLNVNGSITDGFAPPQATPDDNAWTILSGTTLTSNATTSQAVTLGTGTTISGNSGAALSYDIAIDANAIAANVPIAIAVTTSSGTTLSTSWTTTADIQPPSGPLIPKGTILPAGFTIPSGSVLSAGSMLPQQVGITAMTVPKGTPLKMFAQALTLTAPANLLAGDTILSGSTLVLPGLSSGLVSSSITVAASLQLAAGSTLSTSDDFGNPVALGYAVTITNAFPTSSASARTVPFAFTSSTDFTQPLDWVANQSIFDSGGTRIYSAGQTVPAGMTLPAGTMFSAGTTFPSRPPSFGLATIPAGTPLGQYISDAFVTLSAVSNLQSGDIIPSGSDIIILNAPTPSIALRATGSGGIQGKNWATAPLLAAGSQSWSLRLVSGADLGAADTRVVEPASTLKASGASGNLTLSDGHYSMIKNESYYYYFGGYNHGPIPGNGTGFLCAYFSCTPGPTTVAMGAAAPSVLRTGTGNLDLIAGGSFDEQSLFGVYTAGTQSQPVLAPDGSNPYNLPRGKQSDGTLFGAVDPLYVTASANYQAWYPEHGGDVFIAVQGDLSGHLDAADSSLNSLDSVAAGNWLWRQGGSVVGQPAAWWINFGAYVLPNTGGFPATTPILTGFTGIGTLGGGNVNVLVGGSAGIDANTANGGLDIVVASTGRVKSDGTLVQTGGGDLTLKVGGAINGTLNNQPSNSMTGTLVDLRGNIDIQTSSIGQIGLNYGGSDILDPRAADPFTAASASASSGLVVMPGDGTVNIATRGDLVLDGAGDAGRVVQQNATPYTANGVSQNGGGNSWFSLWTDATAINLFSAGGNLTPSLQIQQAGGNPGLGGNDGLNDTGRFIFPGSLSAIAAEGNIYFINRGGINPPPALELAPSANGQLNLLAGGSVFGAGTTVDMSGAAPSVLATPFNVAFQSADNSVSNINLDSYGGTTDMLFAFGADTAAGNLHQNDSQPIRIYAGAGDIVDLQVGEVLTWNGLAHKSPLTWYIGAKPVWMMAGRDIVSSGTPLNVPAFSAASMGNAQAMTSGDFFLNVDATDISQVHAGRDIIYSSFTVAGPGLMDVEAGRNFYAGNRGTLTSVGQVAGATQQSNDSGAGITLMAGVGQNGPDYADFAKLYLDPANVIGAGALADQPGKVVKTYDAELAAWLKDRFGYAATGTGDALAYFDALPAEQQAVFVRQVYFDELKAGGREETGAIASPRLGSYLRGRNAIAALFPDQDATGNPITYAGNITMFSGKVSTNGNTGRIDLIPNGGDTPAFSDSGIRTNFGGDVQIFAPGGAATLGAEGVIPGASAGVLTQGSGDIDIYSDDSVLLGLSRVFTTFGGNILMWSATGDINAGRGAKGTVVFTPPKRVYDTIGDVALAPTVPTSGAGIGTLNPIPEVQAGDVDLIAPLGTIDAGEAGIRVSGNVNLAALQVVNAANIQVQGKSTGLPPIASVNVGALANAGAAATQAALAAQDVVQQERNAARQALPSIFTVRVLGFGNDPAGGSGAAPQPQSSGLQSKGVPYDPANPVQLIGVDQDLDPRQMARLSAEQQRQLQRGR